MSSRRPAQAAAMAAGEAAGPGRSPPADAASRGAGPASIPPSSTAAGHCCRDGRARCSHRHRSIGAAEAGAAVFRAGKGLHQIQLDAVAGQKSAPSRRRHSPSAFEARFRQRTCPRSRNATCQSHAASRPDAPQPSSRSSSPARPERCTGWQTQNRRANRDPSRSDTAADGLHAAPPPADARHAEASTECAAQHPPQSA